MMRTGHAKASWPDPVLLTTLYPTGATDVRAFTGSPGVKTRGDETGEAEWTAAKVRDADDGTFLWLKTVNTGGYGTNTIRRVNWSVDTCPSYTHIAYLKARCKAQKVLSGTMGSEGHYYGVEVDDSIGGNPLTTTPPDAPTWTVQDYLFASYLGAEWPDALVNGHKFGTDWDQYLASGNPANNVEYRVAEYALQVWGNA